MKHKLVILFILALTGAASAQTTAFTYQGHLMDAGASANGNYDLQFTLKNALMDGSTVGTPQAVSPVTAVNGIFGVTLDFGSASFDGSDRWVELGVRPAGSVAPYTVLAPRQRLTPGSGRAIVWNAGTDWNNLLSTTMRYRITADVRISGECAPATPSNA